MKKKRTRRSYGGAAMAAKLGTGLKEGGAMALRKGMNVTGYTLRKGMNATGYTLKKGREGVGLAFQKTGEGAGLAYTKASNATSAVTQKLKNTYSALPSRMNIAAKVKGMALKTPSAKNVYNTVKGFKASSLTEMFTTKEKTGNEEPECSYFEMLKYGALSILLSPLYVATVLANLPMNTINNLSDNRLKEVEIDALSKQLYRYLFYGYKNSKDIDYTQFSLPDPGNIIQDKKIVVGCNSCKKTQREFRAEQFGQTSKPGQTGGMVGGKVEFLKMVKNSLGILGGKSKLEFNLKDTLDYVENIPKLNYERREHLDHSIRRITDVKMMAKMLILMNTLFVRNGQDECENPINLGQGAKTVIDSVQVSRIMNPFAIMESYSQKENKFKIDYKETSRCIIKHMLSDTFTGDECRNKCTTCTFQNNITTLMSNYLRLLSNVFRGNERGMVTIIQTFFSIMTKHQLKEDPNEKHELYKTLAESYITKLRDEFYTELFAIRYDLNVEDFIDENRESYDTFKKLFCDYGLSNAIREHTKDLIEKSLIDTNKLKGGSLPYYKTKIRSFFKTNFYFIAA